MLLDLHAPQGAMVIMDRGVANKNNIAWLAEQGYRYLVVGRERTREFDLSKADTIHSAAGAEIYIERHADPETGDVDCLYSSVAPPWNDPGPAMC